MQIKQLYCTFANNLAKIRRKITIFNNMRQISNNLKAKSNKNHKNIFLSPISPTLDIVDV